MRVLRVFDLHHALKQHGWTMAAAPGFDTVVIAGDHLSIADPVDASVEGEARAHDLAGVPRQLLAQIGMGDQVRQRRRQLVGRTRRDQQAVLAIGDEFADGRGAAISVVLFLAVIPVMIWNVRRFREQEAMR